MLAALYIFYEYSRRGGMFINSCFAHCQSESQDTWYAVDSPKVHNKVHNLNYLMEHNYILIGIAIIYTKSKLP